MFQSSLSDPKLTVAENLTVRAGFYGLNRQATTQRMRELTALVALEEPVSCRYGTLSGGQRHRADAVGALLALCAGFATLGTWRLTHPIR